jgi:hypothetical protein
MQAVQSVRPSGGSMAAVARRQFAVLRRANRS